MWQIVVAVVGTIVLLVGLSTVGRWLAAQDWRLERGYLRAAGLLPHLDPRHARVDRGDRRRAGFEPPRGRRRRVVVDVHLEDVPVREPAGLRGPERLDELGAAVEEAEPGRAEQILEDAGAQE